MAIAFDAGSSTFGGTVASITLSHTCSGSDRALFVGIALNALADNVSGVTYAGVAMTRTRRDAGGVSTYVYELAAPATGANNIVVTFTTGGQNAGVFGASFTGVDQTNVSDTDSGSSTGSQASPRSDNITVSSGGYAFDVIGATGSASLTPGGSQTRVGVEQSFSTISKFGASYLAGASAMSWSWTGGNRGVAHTVVAIKAASSGTDTPISPGVGNVALTGHAPTVAQPQTANPDAGELAITGHAPTITQAVNQAVNPDAGSIVISGHVPAIAQTANQDLEPDVGAMTVTGYAPSVEQASGSQSASPDVGELTIAGHAPTVAQSSPSSMRPKGKSFSRWRIKRPEDYENYQPEVIVVAQSPRPAPIIIEPQPVDVAKVTALAREELKQALKNELSHAIDAYRAFRNDLIEQERERLTQKRIEELQQQIEAAKLEEQRLARLKKQIEDDEEVIEMLLML